MEPLFAATLRDHTAATAVAAVRDGLRWCSRCRAVGSLPCRTASGRVAARHVGRA